jgi:hypothetical protein
LHWLAGAYFGHGVERSKTPAQVVRGNMAQQKAQGIEALMRFMDGAKTLQ